MSVQLAEKEIMEKTSKQAEEKDKEINSDDEETQLTEGVNQNGDATKKKNKKKKKKPANAANSVADVGDVKVETVKANLNELKLVEAEKKQGK
jgi:hypothetical protein